jgi:flagellar hook-associated protein 2
MTTAQIVEALNTAFSSPVAHELTTAAAFTSDAAGTTPADASTTFAALHSGGAASGAVAGDTIEYAGKRPDGTGFSTTFTIGDPATTTLGDFVAHVRATIGSGATVSIVDGRIVTQATEPGPSSLDLSITPKNEGGGTLSFGAMGFDRGHNGVSLSASAVGGEIRIEHQLYGSAYGVTITGTGSGIAQLGIADGTVKGLDVAGTIGGQAATGSGRQLTVDGDQPAAGLTVEYGGATANAAAGSVTLTVGAGALLERLANGWLTANTGLLATKETSVNARITSLESRAERIEDRLELRRQYLLKSYIQMEVAMGRLQSQTQSFAALISGQNNSK